MDTATYPKDVLLRLKSKIAFKDSDECWKWLGALGNGYPQLWVDGKMVLATYIMYKYVYSAIPVNMQVLHSCDNSWCINPNHLFLGTQRQNTEDKVAKGRHSYGEKHGMARLSEAQVIEIIADKYKSRLELAKKFNVPRYIIDQIKQGKTWRHLPR